MPDPTPTPSKHRAPGHRTHHVQMQGHAAEAPAPSETAQRPLAFPECLGAGKQQQRTKFSLRPRCPAPGCGACFCCSSAVALGRARCYPAYLQRGDPGRWPRARRSLRKPRPAPHGVQHGSGSSGRFSPARPPAAGHLAQAAG